MEHGFSLLRSAHLSDDGATASLFRHVVTGADVLVIPCGDEECFLGAGLRTPPDQDLGIPHVLEHLVLAGSQAFPDLDLVGALLFGSPATFANGATRPDTTVYGVAARGQRNHLALIPILVEALYRPQLSATVFEELVGPPDGTGAGVVVSEMTGVFGSPDHLHPLEARRQLLAGHPCSGVSGGDPDRLRKLAVGDVRAYHRVHYVPSNTLFFLYGDVDVTGALSALDAALGDAPGSPAAAHTGPPVRGPVRAVTRAVAGSTSVAGVNWALPPLTDAANRFAARVLAHALADPACGLLSARLAALGSPSNRPALELHGCAPVFGVAVGDVTEDRLDTVERTVTEVVARVADEGLPAGDLTRACNRVEMALRQPRAGGGGAGRALFDRVMTAWPYGGDPLAELRLDEASARVRAWCEDPGGHMRHLVRTWISENDHRVTLLTLPGDTSRDLHTGKDQRRKKVSGSTRRKRRPPFFGDFTLDHASEVPQEVGMTAAGVPVQHCVLPTHGLVHIDVAVSLAGLPAELIALVPVWARAVSRAVENEAADLGARARHSFLPGRPRDGDAYVVLHTQCLRQHAEMLAVILGRVIPGSVSAAEVKTATEAQRAFLRGLRGPRIHRLVDTRLFSGIDVEGWLDELVTGKSAWDRLTSAPPDAAQIAEIRGRILGRGRVFLGLTTSWEEETDQARATAEHLAGQLAGHRTELVPEPPASGWGPAEPSRLEVLEAPAPLHTVGCVLHPPRGTVTPEHQAVASHLTGGWLMEHVRERGGAYAGLMDADDLRGTLRLLSLRDPRDAGTLRDFLRLGTELVALRPSKEDIRHAVLGAVKQIVPAGTAAERGLAARREWLAGRPATDIARRVERLVHTGPEHFTEVGVQLERLADQGTFVAHAAPDDAAETEDRLRRVLESAPEAAR
ncbi:insulinase family protein [Streptomyces sp. NPDC004546]|uniref:insulinase family protein n=1 Tax=Streptomyces sp. NPDC004546 TaxID=3154282 RepID=UPI0033AEF532